MCSTEYLQRIFSFQQRGTGGIGAVFGPVMLVWFFTLALLGLVNIVQSPAIVEAMNPVHAVRFFARNGRLAFLVLGSVFLVVTGGEALYADMGHFGARPIRTAWFVVALPALLLNYFGQGALLLRRPETIASPFFNLAPSWALYPVVGLSTMATIIASQALISGAFSVTRQALMLGYLPRVKIEHTSAHQIGQIITEEIARVAAEDRVRVEELPNGSRRAVARYGFMETPDVPKLLERPELKEYSIDHVTFFLGRETVLPTHARGMALWRERLFAFLTRNAQPATAFFGIPPNRVMEIGAQIEICGAAALARRPSCRARR